MSTARTDDEMREFLRSKVSISEESGCWLWLGGLDKDGYGQTHYRGKNIRAHRVTWILANGAIPAEMVVMHECDTPACINPAHLKLGTNLENNEDKMQKKRHRVASGDAHYMRKRPGQRAGEKCPTAKLDEAAARRILKQISEGKGQREIASEFGVSRTAISAIATGRNWKHLNHTTGATE
jgi:hypothetical protein